LPAPPGDPKWAARIALLGAVAGLVSEGLMIKFALDGRDANRELEAKCATRCSTAEANAIDATGTSANRNALIAGAAGGIFIVSSVVLYALTRDDASSDDDDEEDDEEDCSGDISLAIESGGATATYSWRF
jgi:hypothetical protein